MPAPEPTHEPDELPTTWRYEQTVVEIERIITEIEAGNLDLADVFEQFAQAVTYLQQCEAFLGDRQGQLDLLLEQLGNPSDPS